MGAMTLSATREWDFSSEQGKANYKAAQRRYPAQAIVDLAAPVSYTHLRAHET